MAVQLPFSQKRRTSPSGCTTLPHRCSNLSRSITVRLSKNMRKSLSLMGMQMVRQGMRCCWGNSMTFRHKCQILKDASKLYSHQLSALHRLRRACLVPLWQQLASPPDSCAENMNESKCQSIPSHQGCCTVFCPPNLSSGATKASWKLTLLKYVLEALWRLLHFAIHWFLHKRAESTNHSNRWCYLFCRCWLCRHTALDHNQTIHHLWYRRHKWHSE